MHIYVVESADEELVKLLEKVRDLLRSGAGLGPQEVG